MLWRQGRRSDNVEDRRGQSAGGFTGRFPGGARGAGVGGGLGAIVLLLLALFFGFDPSALLQTGPVPGGAPPSQPSLAPPQRQTPQEAELAEFVSVVLADTEDVWHRLFGELGQTYAEPKLVLFSGEVASTCGYASTAVGPFYCPQDRKVYLDLEFFNEMQRRMGARGDFAQAYVIAHEIGHHVQNLLGILPRVEATKRQLGPEDANRVSVMTELQADCFAGVWAAQAQKMRQILEAGDLEEAINAAAAVGDDRLQRRARGYVVPDSFTHGSSAQRMQWFRIGLQSGRPQACDTFGAARL